MLKKLEQYLLLNHPLLWTSGITAFVPLFFVIFIFNLILALILNISPTYAPNIAPIIYAELIIILLYHVGFIYGKGKWLVEFCQTFKRSLLVSLILTLNITLFLAATFFLQSIMKQRLTHLLGSVARNPSRWDINTIGLFSHNKVAYPNHQLDPILDVSTDSSTAQVTSKLLHINNKNLFYDVSESRGDTVFVLDVYDSESYKDDRQLKSQVFGKLTSRKIVYDNQTQYTVFKNSFIIAYMDLNSKQIGSNQVFQYCYYDDQSNYRVYCFEDMVMANMIYSKLRYRLSGVKSTEVTKYVRDQLENFKFIFTFSLFPNEDQEFHLSNVYIFMFIGIGYLLLLAKHLPPDELGINFALSFIVIFFGIGISYIYDLGIIAKVFLVGNSVIPLVLSIIAAVLAINFWLYLSKVNERNAVSSRKIYFAFLFSVYTQFIVCQYLYNLEFASSLSKFVFICFILWITNAFLLFRLRVFEWLPKS